MSRYRIDTSAAVEKAAAVTEPDMLSSSEQASLRQEATENSAYYLKVFGQTTPPSSGDYSIPEGSVRPNPSR